MEKFNHKFFNFLFTHKKAIVIHVVLIISTAVIVLPLFFLFIKATQDSSASMSQSIIPGKYLISNLSYAWKNYNFAQLSKNTFIIATAVTFGKTVFSLLAALVLVYFKIPFKPFIFGLILITFYIPTDLIAVGLFNLISQKTPSWSVFVSWISNPFKSLVSPLPFGLQWTNTYSSVIVPFLASATGTFLFIQHFRTIPRSFVEVALMEGINPISYLFRVLIPISWNTIGALWVIQFVYFWNQYFWPRLILRDNDSQVIQVGLGAIFKGVDQIEWGVLMAAALLVILPPMIVFLVLIKQLRQGVALSTGK